jgi:hypothetical protein
MEQQIIVLGKISKAQKDKYHFFSHVELRHKNGNNYNNKNMNVKEGLSGGGEERGARR